LAATAGILVPLIVHLWNDRRGKVLRIGSVALLTGASRRLAWSRRLTERGLLVLRCLLLLLLALLLAEPYWSRAGRGGPTGWVLVAEDSGRMRPVIDSLVKAGYEKRVLDSTVDYWTAFRQADTLAPAGMPMVVVTPGLASRFAGMRPVTGREVHWTVYTPDDSVTHWVEAAWRISPDSIVVLSGSSRSTGTDFRRERVATRAAGYEGVIVDTAAMKVVVGDGGNQQEGKYMRAALKALGDHTGRKLRIVSPGTDLAQVIRWQPEWEAAAWNGRLPVLLGELLFPSRDVVRNDRRMMDPGQVSPVRTAVTGKGSSETTVVDLKPFVWGIVFILFFLERIKAFSHGARKA